MEIVIKILQCILSLSLLVFIHELGHFIFARMFGVRVDKFYIFFDAWGVSLLKFKVGGTTFGIGWIPFGGYCKISGMIDESMDTEHLKHEPQPYEFRSKPAWQRLLIMTGGVIMNLVLAVVVYVGISYRWGEQYVAAGDVEYGYAFTELGRKAGFENGDKVLAVDGRDVADWQWSKILGTMVLEQLPPVEVERGAERVTVQVPEELIEPMLGDRFMTPRVPFVVGRAGGGFEVGDSLVAVDGKAVRFADEFQREFGGLKGRAARVAFVRAGVVDTLLAAVSAEGAIAARAYGYGRFLPERTRTYTFVQSIPAGFRAAGEQIGGYWKNLKLIFTPKTGAYKSVGGFMAIGNMFTGVWDWHMFWEITALISVILAVMNILPIPALDGGHVLFLLWEVVTRRRPSDKFLEHAQVVGLVLILCLLVYANGNDIYKLFMK